MSKTNTALRVPGNASAQKGQQMSKATPNARVGITDGRDLGIRTQKGVQGSTPSPVP